MREPEPISDKLFALLVGLGLGFLTGFFYSAVWRVVSRLYG